VSDPYLLYLPNKNMLKQKKKDRKKKKKRKKKKEKWCVHSGETGITSLAVFGLA
jgi:hypothetical protein